RQHEGSKNLICGVVQARLERLWNGSQKRFDSRDCLSTQLVSPEKICEDQTAFRVNSPFRLGKQATLLRGGLLLLLLWWRRRHGSATLWGPLGLRRCRKPRPAHECHGREYGDGSYRAGAYPTRHWLS